MSHEPGQYRVERRDNLNGRRVIVMDGFFEPPARDGSGRVVHERVRGWIDPKAGYLPLRLERAFIDSAGGYRMTTCVVEVLEVREVAGAHYPAETRIQEYRGLTQTGQVVAGAPAVRFLPGRVKQWKVLEIKPHQPIEPAVLALEFPAGALYSNAVDNKSYRAGSTVPLPEPHQPLQYGQFAPPLHVARWIDGGSRTLADFRGRVVVLEFTDSQRASAAEIAAMKVFHANYARKDVAFVLIEPARSDVNALYAFRQQHKLDAWIAVDQGNDAANSATARDYCGGQVPGMAFVIGRDGRIAFNPDSLGEDAYTYQLYRAAQALSIPWPIHDKGPKDQVAQQGLRLYYHIIGEAIERALEAR